LSEATHTRLGGLHPANPAANVASKSPVIVGAGADFEGVLTCRESSRIDGRVRGDIVGDDRIELGQESDVSGRIEAKDIVVAGKFTGDLIASRRIELLATAEVTGELRARELTAEEGCLVKGRCRTGEVS
jgi:cytoskeletal protein CcmA (bactofilin family)